MRKAEPDLWASIVTDFELTIWYLWTMIIQCTSVYISKVTNLSSFLYKNTPFLVTSLVLLALLNWKSSCFNFSLWDSWPCRLNRFIPSQHQCGAWRLTEAHCMEKKQGKKYELHHLKVIFEKHFFSFVQ